MIRWWVALALLAEEPQIILGVLEETPGHYADQPASRAVRVVFQKNGHEWQPFDNSSQYVHGVTWTIAFSGRSLGQVTGTADITSHGPIPTVGKRSTEYGGFLGTAVFRPLIANSQPYFKDPDGWKPSHPSSEAAAALRAQFRKKFPQVSNCTSEGSDAKPWPYRDADIRLAKAYSSTRRWSVVQLLLERYRCEGPIEDAFAGQWFAVSARGEIKFIGQGMWLVDAGDYDNDGKSEVVFSIDRYNEGGYELFYNDFAGHAVFQFGYH
jgi:hypothetical protein